MARSIFMMRPSCLLPFYAQAKWSLSPSASFWNLWQLGCFRFLLSFFSHPPLPYLWALLVFPLPSLIACLFAQWLAPANCSDLFTSLEVCFAPLCGVFDFSFSLSVSEHAIYIFLG